MPPTTKILKSRGRSLFAFEGLKPNNSPHSVCHDIDRGRSLFAFQGLKLNELVRQKEFIGRAAAACLPLRD